MQESGTTIETIWTPLASPPGLTSTSQSDPELIGFQDNYEQLLSPESAEDTNFEELNTFTVEQGGPTFDIDMDLEWPPQEDPSTSNLTNIFQSQLSNAVMDDIWDECHELPALEPLASQESCNMEPLFTNQDFVQYWPSAPEDTEFITLKIDQPFHKDDLAVQGIHGPPSPANNLQPGPRETLDGIWLNAISEEDHDVLYYC